MSSISIPGVVDLVEIGRGGSATVYSGTQAAFGRTVAVKVLTTRITDAGQQERFERECRSIGALSHPNIVTVFSAGVTDDDYPYLVMEHLPSSLADRLQVDLRIPWREAVDIGVALAGAVAAAHQAGVLHRDIKPENVMVGRNGTPKLTDFGLARLVGGFESETHTVRASLTHAAPESIEGKAVSPATDVYSLASTIHHLIAGSPPFIRPDDESLVAIMGRILRQPPPSLAAYGVPPALDATLGRTMSKDPADRPQSVDEFVAALDAAIVGTPLTSAGPAAVATNDHRRRWLIPIAAVLLIGAGGVAFASRDDSDPVADPDPTTTVADSSTSTEQASTTTEPTSTTSEPPTTTVASTTVPVTTSAIDTATTQSAVVVPPSNSPTTTTRPRTTGTTPPAVTPTAPPTAPPTTAPPTVTDPPPPPPSQASVPNVINYNTSAARSLIVDQMGFAGTTISPGSCDLSSIVTRYSPTGTQPKSTVVTLWCD
jgi:serine/threonine protein kinase